MSLQENSAQCEIQNIEWYRKRGGYANKEYYGEKVYRDAFGGTGDFHRHRPV